MIDPTIPDPIPPSSVSPEAPVAPVAPVAPGLQPNVAAALACLFSLPGGIVFLVLEKKNKFVRFYAMQSVLLGGVYFIVFTIASVVSVILSKIPFLGWLLNSVIWLVLSVAFTVLWIITIVKAFSGSEWEIPVLGPIARKQIVSGPFSQI